MILVTHDFEDAATLADRVGVIVEGDAPGRTPAELVAAPRDPFVARVHRGEPAPRRGRAGSTTG